MSHYPERIVCLTEETTETLYLLGEQQRIVGISGYTVRPAQARREKPKVSAFTSAKLPKILALSPDLVLGFSDMQGDIAAALIRAGIQVHVFNQRSVIGILNMIQLLGAMVGVPEKAHALVASYSQRLEAMRYSVHDAAPRPRIYFEEWDDPMITGIGWVSELIAIAGGTDCFSDLSSAGLARDRIIADPNAVVQRSPDIIVGSWCGKRFRPERVCARSGWDSIPAVRHQMVLEIKSSDILQPGPAALTDGLDQLHAAVRRWRTNIAGQPS